MCDCSDDDVARACNVVRAAQVLNMVCEDCGKPCRNKTQQDLHTKHTGHTKFVDKVSCVYNRISHSVKLARLMAKYCRMAPCTELLIIAVDE